MHYSFDRVARANNTRCLVIAVKRHLQKVSAAENLAFNLSQSDECLGILEHGVKISLSFVVELLANYISHSPSTTTVGLFRFSSSLQMTALVHDRGVAL